LRYSGEGHSERFDEMVKEVVNLKPDVIFVNSTRLLFSFKQATAAIPIVSMMADPVRAGLVTSMARPGGNIAGVAIDQGIDALEKRIELLKQAAPRTATPAKLHIPPDIDVRYIRNKLRLSQDDFAAAFGFTLNQITAWEQGRSRPLGGVRAYLMLIDREPGTVFGMLRSLRDARKAA
jgi:DNA-binding transcriptional regulator YiaG